MEQYKSMAKSIEQIKKPLIYIALISALTHILILGTGILINHQEDNKKFSAMKTCYVGMKELFENNPTEKLFNKSVLKDVKEHTFEIEEIGLIKQLSGFRCDVVAKDSKGHRSFRVALEKNASFPHFYKIADVKEQRLAARYQWEDSL